MSRLIHIDQFLESTYNCLILGDGNTARVDVCQHGVKDVRESWLRTTEVVANE